MDVLTTIIPIFAIIFLGWAARWKGFIPEEFLGPANRLVYYLAIPALIFRAISKASIKAQFNVTVLVITLICVFVVFVLVWIFGAMGHLKGGRLGTFIQSCVHGNLGYIGLAVAYYFLGEKGFVKTSIIAGFLMILQNLLAVIALQLNSNYRGLKENKFSIILRIAGNPVILSAISGIIFSLAELKMPLVIDRSLQILSGLALPTALLLIGASLSFKLIQRKMASVLSTGIIKLLLMPGLGLLLYRISGLSLHDYLPGLILLASPTATLTYVMAGEMGGDTDFAVAAISLNTLLSALTFTLWLHVAF